MGHSNGALTAQQFARLFPDAVAGVVLVEPDLGGVPLRVISGDPLRLESMFRPRGLDDAALVAWIDTLHTELAGLSTAGERVNVPGSGHYPHLEQPALVAATILDLVRSVREAE